jgi:hypothetical protein
MAFSAGLAWDVRTTGDNSNGGGFNVNASGTDYSQQDSPQVTYTDLVIDASVNTKLTSAANPFTSAHVGNVINITSGTGFTVQRVEILSVAAGVATCDKSCGTLSSTGGNGKLGGGLQTIATTTTYMNNATNAMVTYIKSGTYTLTTKITVQPGNQQPEAYIGYQTTHGDLGTPPLITTATNSTILFDIGAHSGSILSFINLNLSNTAGTRSYGIFGGQNYAQVFAYKCMFDGFTDAIQGSGGITGYGITMSMWNCEVKNCTDDGIDVSGGLNVVQSYIHNNTGEGLQNDSTVAAWVVDSIIAANGGDGMKWTTQNQQINVQGCTIAGNGGDGIKIPGTNGTQWVLLRGVNNIFYGNTGYALNQTSSTGLASSSAGPNYLINCAFGSNTAGNLDSDATAATRNLSPVTLTADPFTASGSGDYSLNATAGGGAACRDAGVPGAFPGGLTTGYVDIGAAQVAAAGGGGGGVKTGVGMNGGING